jgi:hypothetical protein
MLYFAIKGRKSVDNCEASAKEIAKMIMIAHCYIAFPRFEVFTVDAIDLEKIVDTRNEFKLFL